MHAQAREEQGLARNDAWQWTTADALADQCKIPQWTPGEFVKVARAVRSAQAGLGVVGVGQDRTQGGEDVVGGAVNGDSSQAHGMYTILLIGDSNLRQYFEAACCLWSSRITDGFFMHDCNDNGDGCVFEKHAVPVFGETSGGAQYDIRSTGCHANFTGTQLHRTDHHHPITRTLTPRQRIHIDIYIRGSCAQTNGCQSKLRWAHTTTTLTAHRLIMP